ncbi:MULTISPECIES: DUF2897 family protein [Halomonadaceae]|uniref:DUF2897 family protein n=1 Tax=Vreelandella halophila TaxID=86177 RepID=A0A9X4YF10_9GAMM|nr:MULTISPECIES: DUF2897 family protein [Halomonas]MYL28008.1 DUF2897 family protein [Halomonas utahensis]MYL75643.1 DUF2897 family protein [Halomonas sp. 22501_18_FS]
MSATEWIIFVLVIGSMLGGLFWLRDSARKLNMSSEQMERIRKRKAELEEEERKQEQEEER